EFQFDAFHRQQLSVLFGERVFGLGEDGDQLCLCQFGQDGHHGEATDEFGNKTEAQQIFGLDMFQDSLPINGGQFVALFGGAKTKDVLTEAALDDALQADERAAAYKEDVRCVHADVFLLRVFAPALRRDVADCPLQNLQQRLLHAFAGNVACDGDVLGLAGDLVNFVNINDAALRALHIVIGVLQQPENDILDV